MPAEPDDITLTRQRIAGMVQARDAIGHQIAIESQKLEMLIEQKRSEIRTELCDTQ